MSGYDDDNSCNIKVEPDDEKILNTEENYDVKVMVEAINGLSAEEKSGNVLDDSKQRKRESALLQNHDVKKMTTDEAREFIKKKKREYERKRRQSMTQEQKEKYNSRRKEQKEKRSERRRMLEKQSLKRMAELFPEKWQARLERRRLAERERRKRKMGILPKKGEQGILENVELQQGCSKPVAGLTKAQEEERNKKKFRYIEKIASMTEEELKQHKMRQFFSHHAWYKNKGPYKNWSEEEKEKSRRQQRERARNLTGEKRKQWMESVKRARKKWLAKMKEENNEKWKKHQEKIKEYMRRKVAEETPDERLRRHHKYKVNTAARKLKQQLTSEQVALEEIERKVTELRTTMWKEFDPDYDKRPPKPRGRKRRVTPPPEKEQSQETVSFSIPPFLSSTSNKGNNMNVNTAATDNLGVNSAMPRHTDSIYIFDSSIDNVSEHVNYEPDFSPCASPEASPHLPSPSPEPSPSTRFNPADVQSPTPNSPCLHCPRVFCGDDLLRAHVCAMHPHKCWKCPKCQKIVLSPLELSQHYNSAHKAIQAEQSTKLNEVQPISGYQFICMRCSVSSEVPHLRDFKTRLDLFNHVEAEHPSYYWPCRFCNLLKYSQRSLKLHQILCCELRSCQKR